MVAGDMSDLITHSVDDTVGRDNVVSPTIDLQIGGRPTLSRPTSKG